MQTRSVHLLVLPGNHPSIRVWAERVAKVLTPNFERTYVHGYEHWETGEERIDFERELERLPPLDPNSVVLGKSAGAVLALLAIERALLNPQRLVLVGLPLRFTRALNIDLAGPIGNLTLPTLLVQQTHDHGGAFREAAELVARCRTSTTIEVPGDDHLYEDVDELARVVETWMSGAS